MAAFVNAITRRRLAADGPMSSPKVLAAIDASAPN